MGTAVLKTTITCFFALFVCCHANGQTADSVSGKVEPLAEKQVTVLIFVRSDCPISNRYAPEIQRLANEFHGKARFWLVYPDRRESSQTVKKHTAEYGYKLAVLLDSKHEFVHKAKARVTPQAAVFMGNELRYSGRVDDQFIDFGKSRPAASVHDLENAIRAVLGGTTVSKAAGPAIGCYISDLE
jgi:hypothetical protein